MNKYIQNTLMEYKDAIEKIASHSDITAKTVAFVAFGMTINVIMIADMVKRLENRIKILENMKGE